MMTSLVPSARLLLARGTASSSPLIKQLGSRTGGFARFFSCSHDFVTNPMQKRGHYHPSLRTFSSTSKKTSLPFLLDREIENEGNDEITDSPSLRSLLSKFEKKGFKLEENPDSPVVALVGKGLGSEEVVITLNVMDDITEDEDELEYDEDDEEGDTNLNAQSVPDIRGEDEPPLDDDIESEPTFEISVVIRKGEEEVEFICEASSHIAISRVNFYPDDARFEDEAHFYTGPEFDELDPELQEAFEDYLEKCGIDDDVATFICMYADAKEQNLYVQWMKSVRDFLNK